MNLTKKAPILATLSVLVATALIAACGGATNEQAEQGAPAPQILASDQNIAYFANEIAGDQFTVELVSERAGTLHGFNPTASETIRLGAADNVLIFNLAIEEWVESLPSDIGDADKFISVIDDEYLAVAVKEDADHAHEDETTTTEDDHAHEDEATDDDHAHEDEATDGDDHDLVEEPTDDDHGHEDEEPTDADETVVHDNDAHEDEATDDHADETTADGHDHSHEGVDPHVAVDPPAMINLVENVRDALIKIDPDNRERFTNNAQTLIDRLENLDEAFHTAAETCDHAEFVTDQNLFARLERYGIEALPFFASIDHSSDTSLPQITAILDQIEADGIGHILTVATSESDSLDVRPFVEDYDLEVLQAYSFETLIEGEFDYFDQAEANLEAIRTALGCANLTASG